LLTGTDLIEVRFWQWQNYMDWDTDDRWQGSVSHVSPKKSSHGVLISAFPLILCFCCGVLLYILAGMLSLQYSLIAFGFGTMFIFHMSLSDSDVTNIERYTAELSGFEATVRDVFVRGSQSQTIPVVSILAGVSFVFDPSLWVIVPSFIGFLLIESLFLVYDWWQAR
jgi:hypothetical protein